MDLSIVIPGLILFASVAVPVVYLNRAKVYAEKRLKNIMHQFATSTNSKLSKVEFYQNIGLGIDESAQMLLYIKQHKKETVKTLVNLAEIEKCSIAELKNNGYTVDRLEWVFVNKNSNSVDVVLEFYNASTTNFSIGEELDLLRKWQDIVANAISKISKP
jgi:hypothetical protein